MSINVPAGFRLRSRLFWSSLLILIATLAAICLAPALGDSGTEAAFLPHRTCYLWNSRLITLHVTSDFLIGLSYLAISATLVFLVYKARRSIPFHWMFLAFGLFIVTCGFTHFLEIWTVWFPNYWLAGDVKLLTAVASVATAFALPPLVPRIFGLIQSAKVSEERQLQLERAHRELEILHAKTTQLDRLKSEFFANISHELRTPLALILGPAESLKQAPNLVPDQVQDLETIVRTGYLLLRRVNDLLDAAKLEASRMDVEYQEADFAERIRSSMANFEPLARERRIQLKLEAPPSLTAQLDPDKVQRIFLNLLTNAFKFTPDGGWILVRLKATGDQVELQISDNGPGVPAHLREAIFERFRQGDATATRQFAGTGLGLSIAHDLAELHRGSIDVSDAPGGGALFTVRLPLRAPDGTQVLTARARLSSDQQLINQTLLSLRPTETPALEPSHQDAAGEKTGVPLLLVVEDDPEMNRFVAKCLSPLGNTSAAFNARDGLAKALELKPDLIISDFMMPEMDGGKFLEQIRQRADLNETPVLILTAKADDHLRIELLQKGAQDYLLKPFALDELRVRARNLLVVWQARRALQNELASQNLDLLVLANESVQRKRELEKALAQQQQAQDEIRRINETLEQRVTERTAQLKAANAELEAFTYSVSHDLRAPLRAMQGLAIVLLEDYAAQLDATAKNYAERIVLAARKMDALINDLLTYGRISRGALELRPVKLETAFSEAKSQLASELDRRLPEVTVQLTDSPVRAHPLLLTQTFTNLLSNAIKFVPPGTRPRVRVWSNETEDVVRVWVEDNGIGIAPEYHRKIFQIFERLHTAEQFPGTGIGLAIVFIAMERMGGRCGVESQVGQGSKFWIELPRS